MCVCVSVHAYVCVHACVCVRVNIIDDSLCSAGLFSAHARHWLHSSAEDKRTLIRTASLFGHWVSHITCHRISERGFIS